MSELLDRIRQLHAQDAVRISAHGYDELANDDILARDAIAGLDNAIIVEAYPDYYKGPCLLLLQVDGQGNPIHVLWGIPAGKDSPAVLITAYRPDPARWENDWLRRKE